MDMSRYEQINGREAIRRLLDGDKVYTSSETYYYIEPETGTLWSVIGDYAGQTSERFNTILENDWYIPKPFDVRQAMLERPNEWVGAYTNFEDKWFKVGFDVKRMRPVRAHMNSEAKVNLHDGRVFVIELEDLDLCIPIEDVPEKSKIQGLRPNVAICDEEATR